ncbi:MAG: polysaccharide biosynthesis/export family protein [Planctomycetaceae bacterium]
MSKSQLQLTLTLMAMLVIPIVGCSSTMINGIPAIPAHRVPAQFLVTTKKDDLQPISISRLRQDPPDVYILGPGDILGVYIENVLGNPDELPPVNFPDDPSRAPAIGFPVPIRDDGTVSLPFVAPIKLDGLSIVQATDTIRKAFTIDKQILKPDNDRIIISLIKRRTIQVLVIRQEGGGTEGVTKRGSGATLNMPMYENDVLHALNATGGLPGLDVKNEVLILRGRFESATARDQIVAEIKAGRGVCEGERPLPNDKNTTRIPLRFDPKNPPKFDQDDIILEQGDIILIESREQETYFTGGQLGGGEVALPRDKDLDVVGAIALSGAALGAGMTPLAAAGGGSGGSQFMQSMMGGGGGGGGTVFPPSRVIILREVAGGRQIPIRVDLNRALTDTTHRILIRPKDVVILQNTVAEDFGNVVLSLLSFNYLLRNLNETGF